MAVRRVIGGQWELAQQQLAADGPLLGGEAGGTADAVLVIVYYSPKTGQFRRGLLSKLTAD